MPERNLGFFASQYGNIYAVTIDQTGEPFNTAFEGPRVLDSISTAFVTVFGLMDRALTKDRILVMPVGNRLFFYENPEQASQKGIRHADKWKEFANVGRKVPSGVFVTTLAFSKAQSGILYFGTSSGRLFLCDANSTTGGVEEVTSTIFPKNAFVSSIDCDSAGRVVVSFSNYNVRSVFMANESNMMWLDISDDLEQNAAGTGWGPSVRSVRFRHDFSNNRDYVFAGTSVGLFSRELSSDSVRTPWILEGQTTLGNIIVEAIDVRELDGRMVIGTHGAGVFESIRNNDTNWIDSTTSNYFHLEQNFPNPASFYTFIYYNTPVQSHVKLELFDLLGKKIATLLDSEQLAGRHIVEVGSDVLGNIGSGSCYYKLSSGKQSASRIMTIVK
jgi:hypothetical protein